MKYRCTHCHHHFELAERDFHRCPSCFWTTSLVSLEEDAEAPQSFKQPKPTSSSTPKPNFVNAKLLIILLVCAILGTLVGIFVALKPNLPKFSFPSHIPVPEIVKQRVGDLSQPKSAPSEVTFLNVDEKSQLTKPFQMTIPRQLIQDEEEILKKQISPSKSVSEKPKLSAWNKDDFEKTLEAEQKKRKVYLGWAYERAVGKTFEKNYPQAVEAYEKGDYALARDLFLKALAFPIYQNNLIRHRAVALVMLRPYLNDVIGKIALLNQYMTSEKLAADINSINQSYQELFSILDLQEWDKASQAIADLKRQIDAFENQPPEAPVDYGTAFGLLDPEIRSAVQMEAQSRPEAVANFKTMVVDLNLKEQIVRQNRPAVLLKVQKQSEEISRLLQAGDLEAARSGLKEVQFPPELIDDARAKIALIDQAFALKQDKEEKKK
jgi:hypothetical protein